MFEIILDLSFQFPNDLKGNALPDLRWAIALDTHLLFFSCIPSENGTATCPTESWELMRSRWQGQSKGQIPHSGPQLQNPVFKDCTVRTFCDPFCRHGTVSICRVLLHASVAVLKFCIPFSLSSWRHPDIDTLIASWK